MEQHGASNQLLVVDPESGEVQEREIEIGNTTLDAVEVVAGLRPGDQIVVAAD